MLTAVNMGEVANHAPRSIMVFDDGSPFEYLAELELPQVEIVKCRTFEDVETYMTQVSRAECGQPAILCLDIYCAIHPDFGMFGVDIPLDPSACGFQLYEHVLRKAGKAYEEADVIFFTSHSPPRTRQRAHGLAKKYSQAIMNCERVEIRQRLLDLVVRRGLVPLKAAEALQRPGLTQGDYGALFETLAAEFGFSKAERAAFFKLRSPEQDVQAFLDQSALGSEKIDVLLAISVLLDRIVEQQDKRSYLQTMDILGDGRRGFDLLVSGKTEELLQLKSELEFRLGGEIL